MKKLDLGQTITILANLGVVAGIVFLGIEIQQNNEALEIQARLDREEVLRDGMRYRLGNPELTRAIVRAEIGEELSGEDLFLLEESNRSLFVNMMLAYMQVSDGVLAEEAIPIILWRNAIHEYYPGAAESWPSFKQNLPPEFVQWMQDEIIEPGSPQ